MYVGRLEKLLALYTPMAMCTVNMQGKVTRASEKISDVFKYTGIEGADIFALTRLRLCDIIEAARDLGAGEVQAFLKVTLPLSVPGIISGVSMVFLPSMTNYVVLDMLYNSTYIMGSLIGSYFAAYNWHGGSMIALILLGIICLFTLVTGGTEEDNTRGGALL